MAGQKYNKRGRPRRNGLEVLDREKRGLDGKPLDLGRDEAPADHKLFIMERTREIWQGLLQNNPTGDSYDLHALAMDRAAEELTRRLRTGKKLFPYIRRRGRPLGSGASNVDDATLIREYEIARNAMRAGGSQYSAVAKQLWRRKFHTTFQSVDALRMRIIRAVSKAEHK